MNRRTSWTYSVSWFERVEQDRRVIYAERFDFDSEPVAITKWNRANGLLWVGATFEEPDVSALHRLDFFVSDDGKMVGKPKNTIVRWQHDEPKVA